MSKENYREVAKKLGVTYLFGRWGIKLYSKAPDGPKLWSVRFIPLDGWTFNPPEIIEALANDPDVAISYEDTPDAK